MSFLEFKLGPAFHPLSHFTMPFHRNHHIFMWKWIPCRQTVTSVLGLLYRPETDSTLQYERCVHLWNNYLYRRIRELQRSTNIYNMRYFPQHVLFCTSTVHDQDICIQGYLRILWIGNAISLKIDNIHKRYVLCLKLEYFFKSWKTKPLNATIGREMSVKNNTLEPRSMACHDTIGLLRISK